MRIPLRSGVEALTRGHCSGSAARTSEVEIGPSEKGNGASKDAPNGGTSDGTRRELTGRGRAIAGGVIVVAEAASSLRSAIVTADTVVRANRTVGDGALKRAAGLSVSVGHVLAVVGLVDELCNARERVSDNNNIYSRRMMMVVET
jgi:hypothetical protein